MENISHSHWTIELNKSCMHLSFICRVHLILLCSFCRVVIGYDEGTIMVKLGREVPVASMDNSGKIIWSKHNEIQTVNIKSVGADYDV